MNSLRHFKDFLKLNSVFRADETASSKIGVGEWRNGEWGTGNGERGTGNGERGTGNGERGISKRGNL